MILPSQEFLEVFKATEGALSVSESVAIMNIAAQAPEGLYMELGTYKGKSAMSAAYTLRKYESNRLIPEFILVEPEFKESGWAFNVAKLLDENITKGGILLCIEDDYSFNIIPKYDRYSYVFIDSGSHQDGLPMQEVKLLEDRMVQGGIIAFHDFRSQFIEVEQAYDHLLGTGKYEEINIDWDGIVAYVNKDNSEQGNNSWHHAELKNPCFVGAVRRK